MLHSSLVLTPFTPVTYWCPIRSNCLYL